MKSYMSKTFLPKTKDIQHAWHLVDVEGKTLGRMATQVALLLRGKGKTEFTPHVDAGDHVVVINAAKVAVTGKKLTDKEYQTYSGYPGGQKIFILGDMLKKKPEEVIRRAVKGMLPKGILGRRMMKRLLVYKSNEHPHQAQKPVGLKAS